MRTRLTAITLLLLAAATAFAQTVIPTWTQPTQPGVGWDSGIYRYDGSGNIARIGDDTFAYDGANRLTYSTIHAYRATTTQSFQYDRYGNVLNVTTDVENAADPFVTETSAFTVDGQKNQLTRLCRGTQPCVSFTYDGAGNQTTHGTQVAYTWDAAGAMTELTGSVAHERYVYDANDERVLLVTLDGTQEVARRWTWRDASNKVAREAVEHVGTNVWSDARDYVYRDGSLLASFESPAAPIAERHYHLDHLGTPRLITDAARNKRAEDVYLPFGEKAAGTTAAYIGHTERMRFTGHERDGDGSPYRPTLDYMHARYYLGEGKRFLSVDPGQDWDKSVPQSWNLYAYVRNNPVNASDPDGRQTRSDSPRKNCMDGGSGGCAQAMPRFEKPGFGEVDRLFWRMQGQWSLFAIGAAANSGRVLLTTVLVGMGLGATRATGADDPTATTVALGAADGAMNLTIARTAKDGVAGALNLKDDLNKKGRDDLISGVTSLLLGSATTDFFTYNSRQVVSPAPEAEETQQDPNGEADEVKPKP